MFCIETHAHAREHSACSHMSAAALIARAAEIGLDGLIVTDHGYCWPREDLLAVVREVGADDLLVLCAPEITARSPETGAHEGDYLLFGCEEVPPDPSSAAEVVEFGHQRGALVIAAHPFRAGMGSGDLTYTLPLDGIEVYNQNHSRADVRRCQEAVQQQGFLGIAGSDAHQVEQIGQFVTCLERPIATMAEFVEELRAGRFRLKSTREDMRVGLPDTVSRC
jgi:3',5'-nucleoside bisphosphate phosphatase